LNRESLTRTRAHYLVFKEQFPPSKL